MKRCRVCHRPLRDPTSVKAGIGPVCACKVSKAKEKRKGEQIDMFGSRSKYDFRIDKVNKVLSIVDRNGLKSVTNDMEYVLADIERECGSLSEYTIIYRDSMGIWDGVIKSKDDVMFYSLGGIHCFEDALKKALEGKQDTKHITNERKAG